MVARKKGREGGGEDCSLEAWWRLFLLNFRAVFYPRKPSVCRKAILRGEGCIEKDPCLAQSFCEVEKGHSSIKSTTYNQMILYLKRVVVLEEVRALFTRWDRANPFQSFRCKSSKGEGEKEEGKMLNPLFISFVKIEVSTLSRRRILPRGTTNQRNNNLRNYSCKIVIENSALDLHISSTYFKLKKEKKK